MKKNISLLLLSLQVFTAIGSQQSLIRSELLATGDSACGDLGLSRDKFGSHNVAMKSRVVLQRYPATATISDSNVSLVRMKKMPRTSAIPTLRCPQLQTVVEVTPSFCCCK